MRGLEDIAAYNDAFIAHRGDYRKAKQRQEAQSRRLLNKFRAACVGSKPGGRRVFLAPASTHLGLRLV